MSIGARYVREVFPGEIVELTREGIKTIEIVERPNKKAQAFCIFEYVYFARSDSIFEGTKIRMTEYSTLDIERKARLYYRSNGIFRSYAMRTGASDRICG